MRPASALGPAFVLLAAASLASAQPEAVLSPAYRSVVLFTDGEDNSSWFDAGQLRRVLEESNGLLQTVGVVPVERRAPVPDTPHVRLLRFEPAQGAPAGRHELDVRLVRGEKVHCRKAYYVAPAPRAAGR